MAGLHLPRHHGIISTQLTIKYDCLNEMIFGGVWEVFWVSGRQESSAALTGPWNGLSKTFPLSFSTALSVARTPEITCKINKNETAIATMYTYLENRHVITRLGDGI